MADIRNLTLAQASALDGIIASLRAEGIDPEGLGVYSGNLHCERRGGSLWFALDALAFELHGVLDADGHGAMWRREGADGSAVSV